ncbi:hypothetical protein NC652_023395 [Populus alba x Populus x berolinensis]|nr:hypothetical protein NC652_023395 [Populus alba x Populus x berolinensis]
MIIALLALPQNPIPLRVVGALAQVTALLLEHNSMMPPL